MFYEAAAKYIEYVQSCSTRCVTQTPAYFLTAEELKGTEFQKPRHSKVRNCRCEASLVKPASKMKAGLQQEDCSKEGGAGGSPKHKQLHFTTWNLHRGPQILHLLSLILGIAPAWGGCPEHTAALRAPAEQTRLPHSTPETQGLPAKAFPEGRAPGARTCSCRSWQAGDGSWGSSAMLCSTEQNKRGIISWQIAH